MRRCKWCYGEIELLSESQGWVNAAGSKVCSFAQDVSDTDEHVPA